MSAHSSASGFPPSNGQSTPKRPEMSSREQHLDAVDRMLWCDLQRLFLEDLQSTHLRYSRDALLQRSQRVSGSVSDNATPRTPPPNKKMVFDREASSPPPRQEHGPGEVHRALPPAARASTYRRLYMTLRRFVVPLFLVNLTLWAFILLASVPSDLPGPRTRFGNHHSSDVLELSAKWVDSIAEFLGVPAPRLDHRHIHRVPHGLHHHHQGQRDGAPSPPVAVDGKRINGGGGGGDGIEQYGPHSAWFTMNHGAFPPPRASYLVGEGKPRRVVWFSRVYASPAVILTLPRNDTVGPLQGDEGQAPPVCRKVEAVRW